MIHARSPLDVYNLNDRYLVVKDITSTYRVVSMLRGKFRELQPRENTGGTSYVFNRTGNNPSWDKTSYNQAMLKNTVERYSKTPTVLQLNTLQSDGVVNFGIEAKMAAPLTPSDIQGLPRFDNHQLDPQQGGWIIATVTPTGLLFGSKPKVHTNQGAAEAELQRLATVSPGNEFVLLKAVKTAVTQTVQTKTFA